MAESVLASLVLKLDNLQLQYTKLRPHVKRPRDELVRLCRLLRTTDAMGDGDLEVEVWCQRVRYAAYELEDAIDTFEFIHSKSIKNLAAQTIMVHDLQLFLSNLKTIPLPVPIASHSSNNVNEPSSPASATTQLLPLQQKTNGISTRLKGDCPVGMQEPKKRLTELLIADARVLRVVPVVGNGGLGKTTLAKQIFKDAKIRKHFKIHIWVDVARDFKVNDILNYLIQKLMNGHNEQQKDQGEQKTIEALELKEKVNERLANTRYLIVLDGVWTIDAWHSIKHAFPDNKNGSRVIITTRSVDVAYTSCKSLRHIYNLLPLPENASRILFHRELFGEGSCPDHLREVSESILKRCCGNPMAVLAVSGMLKSKVAAGAVDEWEGIYTNLGSTMGKEEQGFQSTYRILLLSYNDLPFYLKTCYLYLSIFPEDHSIELARLIHLWIAEGLVEVKEGVTSEDVADGYITELLNRSLLQVAETTSDGRVKTCRIPHLMRTIIMMKSTESDFVATNGQDNKEPQSEMVRRLSVQHKLPSIRKRHRHQLRSLVTFDMEEPLTKLFMPSLFSRTFKLLAVLDLKGADINEFPATIVALNNLRYLSLRNTKVKSVPNSIGMLQKLETLDLKHASVDELPNGILKLKRLRVLLVYRNNFVKYLTLNKKKGFRAPQRVGSLQSLQKLCSVDAGRGNGAGTTVSELGKLARLRRLGIVNLREEQSAALCSSLANLTNLRALSLTSSEGEKLDLHHLTSPPKSLQRLYLVGKLEALPDSLKTLQNLVKIFLKSTMLQQNPLGTLAKLPNVVHIELYQAYDGKEFCFRAGPFQKLKLLALRKLQSLERVTIEYMSMPCLERLVLQDCPLLDTVPAGIEHLYRLKKLHLINMPQKLVDASDPLPNKGAYRTVK